MTLELSDIMKKDGRLAQWANAVKYNTELSAEDKEISAVLDNWAKNIGVTGVDADKEVAALVRKALTNDVVAPDNGLLGRIFDIQNIGEFDDIRIQREPKNTIAVYNATVGGNVDRSFVDFTTTTPTWTMLQAETEINYQDLRYNGFKTVARMISYIQEAFETKRLSSVLANIVSAITSGNNYYNETGTAPTDTGMAAMALYLMDMNTTADMPIAVGLNKYMQAASKLTNVTTYLSDREKGFWNRDGLVREYAGVELRGYSGQRTMADGNYAVPDHAIIGFAGKIGSMVMRGNTRVYQSMDNNSEKLHIKATGYTFGHALTTPENAFVMAIA